MPTKRAVLVGINYVGTRVQPQLEGCVNDVLMIKDALVRHYGFPEENIQLLIDSQNGGKYPMPTAQNILDQFSAAIQKSKDDDILLFHYSGHGAQQYDFSGEEDDNENEFLVSYDAQPITDDMLKALLTHASPGVKFTFIADCCHSGTMLDQPKQDIRITGDKSTTEGDPFNNAAAFAPKSRSTPKFVSRELNPEQLLEFIKDTYPSADKYMAASPSISSDLSSDLPDDAGPADWVSTTVSHAAKKAADLPALKMKHCVLVSGCMDDQTSADAFIDGKSNGALSYALVKAIKGASGIPSHREVVSVARDWLATTGYDQDPTLTCDDDIPDLPFICEPAPQAGSGGQRRGLQTSLVPARYVQLLSMA